MTKIEMYTLIKTRLTNTDEIAFIDHEIELLKAKNANRKPSANAIENKSLKLVIISFLEKHENEKFTISELQENISEIAHLKNQRVSAILTQLVNENVIMKRYEKRRPYFSLY